MSVCFLLSSVGVDVNLKVKNAKGRVVNVSASFRYNVHDLYISN